MYNSGDAAEQVVRMSLEGAEFALKITGSAAKNLAAALYTVLKDQKKTKGKARIEAMLREKRPLKVYTIKKEDCPEFAKQAKGYGIRIGSYRGFEMELSYSPIQNAFEMSLRGAISHRLSLGTDARGNLTRMDNALASIPDRLTHTKEQLSNVEYQMEAAKAEREKPFPQAEELAQKSARLAELDAQLNMADSSTVSQEQEKPKTLDEIIAQATAAAAQENAQRRQSPNIRRELER